MRPKGNTPTKFSAVSFLAVLVLGLAMPACSDETIKATGDSRGSRKKEPAAAPAADEESEEQKAQKKKTPNGSDPVTADADNDGVIDTEDEFVDVDGDGSDDRSDEEGDGVVTKNIDNSGASFQVKDILLLTSSLESCMGVDSTKISAEMLLSVSSNGTIISTPESADGKVRFLLPSRYAAGENIVDKEKVNLVDTSGGSRTGVAADALTDTYLRSLETIGNVVAHNCTIDSKLCDCASEPAAYEMLKRCLPGLDPQTVEMVEASKSMSAACAEGPQGMRRVIASLLSSYAFAAAR